MKRIRRGLALALALIVPACGGGGGGGGSVPAPQPDFLLENWNPQPAAPPPYPTVSPRSYLGQVSAYYFGHAT